MILDLGDQVMSSFAPTAIGASIQNYVDRLIKMEDAAGRAVDVLINLAAAVTSAGAATVQFQVVGNATDPTFTAGNVVLFDSGAIAKALLVAGYQIRGTFKRQPITSLQPISTLYRYESILVTIGTAVLTAGTFNGWFTNHENVQVNIPYPAGYTVR